MIGPKLLGMEFLKEELRRGDRLRPVAMPGHDAPLQGAAHPRALELWRHRMDVQTGHAGAQDAVGAPFISRHLRAPDRPQGDHWQRCLGAGKTAAGPDADPCAGAGASVEVIAGGWKIQVGG